MKAEPPHRLASQTTKEEERLHINCHNQMMDRKQLKDEIVLANDVRKYSIRTEEAP